MIAKIVQGQGFRAAVNYVLDKKDADLLYAEGVRLKDNASIVQSFVIQCKLRPNVKKPVAHISLDFSVQDKGRLTDRFMVNVAQEYLQKMGYENTQFIVVRHYDTEHPHAHLIINRIDNDGRRISDQNEKLRNSRICMELTKKHGLYIAVGKENVKEHRLKGLDKVKYEIYHALKSALSICRSWNDLKSELSKAGISVEFRKNGNTEKIQGVKFCKDHYEFNGSKIDRAFSYSKITYQLQQNAELIAVLSSQGNANKSDNAVTVSSSTGTVASLMGDLLNVMKASSGNTGNNAEQLREQSRRKKRRKKGRRL
ncbi:relaxase/mobilization nuclease domain-containing protein [Gaoshiqia sediminis]|uniref:Relaxase/mobilization nuclease domain-containing protein n=1 Tax=Gaoshiqia sediminis TaxID=2986998 RepID=A0AA42C9N5_9BACT|nr:relaxase/mobilization nuclease domain-containing protein [Gaoshiqia sediminis]MCW0482375.1 relaxase/mobilization nuclease domain-containing protein [Gaoshiqia sediminis]